MKDRMSYSKKENIFMIHYEDYLRGFKGTWINYDTAELVKASFLMLDDTTLNSPGKISHCGKSCTRHEFILEATDEEKVLITASTWNKRGYPESCHPETGLWNVFGVEGVKKATGEETKGVILVV